MTRFFENDRMERREERKESLFGVESLIPLIPADNLQPSRNGSRPHFLLAALQFWKGSPMRSPHKLEGAELAFMVWLLRQQKGILAKCVCSLLVMYTVLQSRCNLEFLTVPNSASSFSRRCCRKVRVK